MTDKSREVYLKREIELAGENARAADHMGRYAEAAWWEDRAAELLDELHERGVTADG